MEIEKNLSLVNKRIKASVISGIAEVVATHPIDYWKTVVQSNKSKSLFKQNPYRGVGVRLLGVVPLRVTFWNTLNYCREKKYDSVKCIIYLDKIWKYNNTYFYKWHLHKICVL